MVVWVKQSTIRISSLLACLLKNLIRWFLYLCVYFVYSRGHIEDYPSFAYALNWKYENETINENRHCVIFDIVLLFSSLRWRRLCRPCCLLITLSYSRTLEIYCIWAEIIFVAVSGISDSLIVTISYNRIDQD